MTAIDVILVKDSFRKVAPIADQAAALFYARLFELDPALRPLFRGDMIEQGKKLMTMLATAVAGLERLDAIIPAVRQLGARHAAYGVRDEHYASGRSALLWTLEKGLGPVCSPEVRSAWASTYMLLANTMKQAARVAA